MPACWSRIHISAKILSMKRSSRVPLVSQSATSLPGGAVAESIVDCTFISCSAKMIWILVVRYVVFREAGRNRPRRLVATDFRRPPQRARETTPPSSRCHDLPITRPGGRDDQRLCAGHAKKIKRLAVCRGTGPWRGRASKPADVRLMATGAGQPNERASLDAPRKRSTLSPATRRVTATFEKMMDQQPDLMPAGEIEFGP